MTKRTLFCWAKIYFLSCRDPVLPVGPMTSVQQIYDLVCEGQRNRSTAITKMNEHSSRSHAIISLSLKIPVEKLSSTWANATLNFVDLAGLTSFLLLY